FENLKKLTLWVLAFSLNSDKKPNTLSVNFSCPSLFTGIFTYLYSLKSEFFPSNWKTQEKNKNNKLSQI
ncbi:hypothetical protein Q4504_02685, partial [Mesomycoplasma ovipneumoniae]|uniref:hypothetical protein n=1 Tax=Mesomycoplasma ovipneumoniae TaxID=29562 RepID=UPI0026E295F4